MKAFVISILAAALLALGTIAAACGGGDELSLEEYFEQAQVISDDSDEEFEALYADFPDEDDEEFFSNEENLTVIKDFAARFPVVFRDTLNDVEALDPPAEVEDAHDEFLAAGNELLILFVGLTGPVEEAESVSEAEVLFGDEDDPEIEAADQRFTDACLALEGIAADNGIVVHFGCADE